LSHSLLLGFFVFVFDTLVLPTWLLFTDVLRRPDCLSLPTSLLARLLPHPTLLRPPLHRFSWTNLRRGWYTIFGEYLAILRVSRDLLFQRALIGWTAQRKYSRSFYVDFGFAPLNWVKNRKKLFGNPNSRILGFHFLECKTNALFEIGIR
jgi:hypothetical protein